jgi:hypothetical protein
MLVLRRRDEAFLEMLGKNGVNGTGTVGSFDLG